jgi:hypothetical protein
VIQRSHIGLTRKITFLVALSALGACASSPQPVESADAKVEDVGPSLSYLTGPPLPEGTWRGKLEVRSMPDVDNESPWQQDALVRNCAGEVRVHWVQDDGTENKGMVMKVVQLFPRMFLLSYASMQTHDSIDRGTESQLWTLVDARPKEWTLSLSRAVVNEKDDNPGPWYTFRWMGFGSMKYTPNSCD